MDNIFYKKIEKLFKDKQFESIKFEIDLLGEEEKKDPFDEEVDKILNKVDTKKSTKDYNEEIQKISYNRRHPFSQNLGGLKYTGPSFGGGKKSKKGLFSQLRY